MCMQLSQVSKIKSYFLSWWEGVCFLCYLHSSFSLFLAKQQSSHSSGFLGPMCSLLPKGSWALTALLQFRRLATPCQSSAPALLQGMSLWGGLALLASPGPLRELTLTLLNNLGLLYQICKQQFFSCHSPGSMSSEAGKEGTMTSPQAPGTGPPLPASIIGVLYQRVGTKTVQEQDRESCLHGCPTGRPLASGPLSYFLIAQEQHHPAHV